MIGISPHNERSIMKSNKIVKALFKFPNGDTLGVYDYSTGTFDLPSVTVTEGNGKSELIRHLLSLINIEFYILTHPNCKGEYEFDVSDDFTWDTSKKDGEYRVQRIPIESIA